MGGTRREDGAQFELPLFGGGGDVAAGAAGTRTVPQEPPSPRRALVPAADAAPATLTRTTTPPAAAAPRASSPAVSERPGPSAAAGPRFRVIQGEGKREREKLGSRDAVVRVLLEAGADLLLRRISSERADEIERRVDRILHLFDQVDDQPLLMSVLKRQLDDLEALMRETRELQTAGRRAQPKP